VARPDGVDDPGADQPSAEETVAFLIAKLAPDQKVVLEGRLNGLTYDEIARHLHERGLPEGCVPNHVKYLWKKLVKAWRDEGVRDAESP
jgi:DNA-binding NarL/FixJ family response regulator